MMKRGKNIENEKKQAMYRIKSILVSCLSVLLMLVMAGCGGGSKKMEEDIPSLGFSSCDLGSLEDLDTVLGVTRYGGDILVFGGTEGGSIRKFTSADGMVWEEKEVSTGIAEDGGIVSLRSVDLDENGSMVAGYEVIGSDGSAESCGIWKEDTEETVVLDVPGIEGMSCCKGNIYIYDGEKIMAYGKDSSSELFSIKASGIVDFCAGERELAIMDENGITVYSTEDGEKTGTDSTFTERYADEIRKTEQSLDTEALSCRQVMKYINETKLCIALEDGIYIYDLAEKQIECLLDNTDNGYKAASDVLYGYVIEGAADAPEITAVCSSDGGKKAVLYSNKEDGTENAEAGNGQQGEQTGITVYSLRYAECMENIVDIFRKNNPGVAVNYTWGIDDTDGISVSDAVSALNTQLLAGKGPDVIIMDGLNIKKYGESGVLMELSDMVSEIQENEPACLKDVMSAYQTDSGTYAIPSKVSFTALVGSAGDIEDIDDVDSLISYIQSCDRPSHGNDLNFYEWEAFFDTLYPVYASKIVDANGDYDEVMLREFLVKFKELYDLEMGRTTQEEITDWIKEYGEYAQSYKRISACMKPLYNREYSGQQIAFITTDSILNIWDFYSIKHDVLCGGGGADAGTETTANQNYAYRIWKSEDGNAYIPTMVFSINANSKEKEKAKEFVAYMFNTDIQKQYINSLHFKPGHPVNMDAVKALNDEMLDIGTPGGAVEVGGTDYFFAAYFTRDEDMKEYIEALKSLKTPVYIDASVEEIIKAQMPDYVSGKTGLEDTYNAIHDMVGVYLSE